MMGAYDIETYIDENGYYVPYCIVYFFEKSKKQFYYNEKSDLLLQSIESIFTEKLFKQKKNIFYIHNLDFDGVLILNCLIKNEWKFKCFMRNLSIYSIIVEKDSKIIEFRCSYKLLPVSLKNIAISFNLPPKKIFPYTFSSRQNLFYKGELPDKNYFNFNQLNFENEWKDLKIKNPLFDFREYSIEYCTRDVEITIEFVKKINSLLKTIGFSITKFLSAPSLSYQIFNFKFNTKKLQIRSNFLLDSYIRKAYKGGHTNVYGNPIDGEYIYHYDVPGMYAQVMKEKFPFGKYRFKTNNFNLSESGFYCIEYESNMSIPVLPHHRLFDGKLMFVNGILTDVYTNEEIILHLEQGGLVRKIHYAIVFEKYDYIFTDFVDFFSKWRELGGEHKTFSKLIINSLYGRLGMQEDEFLHLFIDETDFNYYNKNYKIIEFKKINKLLLIKIERSLKFKQQEEDKHSRHKSNISIAAFITSKARIKLYKGFLSVIENNGRLLYTDTDSIIAAFNRKVDNEKHGDIYWDMSKSDTFIKDAVFINPKAYGLLYPNGDEIIKIKGLNQKNISFDLLKKKFYNDETLYIDNYKYISTKDFTLQEKINNKSIALNKYDKRKFSNDKKNTVPFFYKDFKYF